MKKKQKLYVMLLTVAAITIVTAGTINAQIVSGYQSFKNAVRNTITMDNVTLESHVTLTQGGKSLEDSKSIRKIDYPAKQTAEISYYQDPTNNTMRTYENFLDGTRRISHYENPEEEGIQYSVYENASMNDSNYRLIGIQNEHVNIMEMCADAFSGSAKEYLIRTDTENGYTITGNFDRTQIPEIGNALFDLALSQEKQTRTRYESNNSNYKPDDNSLSGLIFNQRIQSGYVNNIILQSTIDKSGTFDTFHLTAQLIFKPEAGGEIPVDVNVDLNFSDKNTTVISIPTVKKGDANVQWQTANADTVLDEETQKIIQRIYKTDERARELLSDENLTDTDRKRIEDAVSAFEAAVKQTPAPDAVQTTEPTPVQTTAPSTEPTPVQSTGATPTIEPTATTAPSTAATVSESESAPAPDSEINQDTAVSADTTATDANTQTDGQTTEAERQ